MTTDEQYQKAAQEAMKVSGMVNSYEAIAGYFPAIYWLSELYVQMVRKREISEISMLKSSHKLILWTSVCTARPNSPKWIKILACYACYMWDLIQESENHTL